MIVRTELLDVAEAVSREQHTELFTLPTAHDELIIADALITPPDKFVALRYQQDSVFSIELGDTCEGQLPRSVETRFLKRGSRVFRSAEAPHSRTSKISAPFGRSARANAAKTASRRSSSFIWS